MRRGALATIVILDSAVVSHELTVYGSRESARLDLCGLEGFAVEATGSLPGSPRARLRRARGMLSHAQGSARAIRRGGDFILAYEDEWRRFAAIVRRDLRADPVLAAGRAALEVALAASSRPKTASPVQVAALGSTP